MNPLTSKEIHCMHFERSEYVPIHDATSRWTQTRSGTALRDDGLRLRAMKLSKKMRSGALFIACICCASSAMNLHAQGQFAQSSALDESDTRSITKANFLFHFAASNEWPAEFMEGPFRLAIIGNPSLHAILADKYAMKSIGSQSLEIIAFDDAESLEKAPFTHVIYSEESGETLQRISESIQDQPVLLISDAADGLQNGALINFVAVNNRIRYEINSEEASKRDLLIGNRILSWAVK